MARNTSEMLHSGRGFTPNTFARTRPAVTGRIGIAGTKPAQDRRPPPRAVPSRAPRTTEDPIVRRRSSGRLSTATAPRSSDVVSVPSRSPLHRERSSVGSRIPHGKIVQRFHPASSRGHFDRVRNPRSAFPIPAQRVATPRPAIRGPSCKSARHPSPRREPPGPSEEDPHLPPPRPSTSRGIPTRIDPEAPPGGAGSGLRRTPTWSTPACGGNG